MNGWRVASLKLAPTFYVEREDDPRLCGLAVML